MMLLLYTVFLNFSWANLIETDHLQKSIGYQLDPISIQNLELEKTAATLMNYGWTPLGQLRIAALLNAPILEREDILARQQAVTEISNLVGIKELLKKFSKEKVFPILEVSSDINKLQYPDYTNFHAIDIFKSSDSLSISLIAFNFLTDLMRYGEISSSSFQVNGFLLAARAIGKMISFLVFKTKEYSKIKMLIQVQSMIKSTLPLLAEVKSPLIQSLIPRLKKWESKELLKLALKIESLEGLKAMPRDLLFGDYLAGAFILKEFKLNKKEFLDTLFAFSELEALLAAANLNLKYERDLSFAEISENSTQFELTNAHHPYQFFEKFGKTESSTPYNIILNSEEIKTLIVTGPQASGKSTFLRALGLLSIINQAGFPVPAEFAALPVVQVITNFNVLDSNEKGMSTFYSQAQRIAQIFKIIDQNPNRLFLLLMDEILKGTSPVEHSAAESAVLMALNNRSNVLVAFSTQNYSTAKKISDEIEGTGAVKLSPYFQLEDGISNQHNAPDILEEEGFPKDVVERARYLLALKLNACPSLF